MEEKGESVVGFGRQVEPIEINGRLGVKLKLLNSCFLALSSILHCNLNRECCLFALSELLSCIVSFTYLMLTFNEVCNQSTEIC